MKIVEHENNGPDLRMNTQTGVLKRESESTRGSGAYKKST